MSRPIQSAITRSVAHGAPGRNLARARAAVDTLNTQLSTGKRIQRASDDPSGFNQAKGLARLQDRLAQHHRGLDAATFWTDRTQQELQALGDLFVEAKEAGLRGANGVVGREELAGQIESLRDEAIARLNAQSDGEYLFAGNATATKPIGADGTIAYPTAADGTLDETTFDGARRREVAPGVTVTVNVTGALTVGDAPAPERLQALADALRAGDTDGIAAALDGVDAGVDHFLRLSSQSGTVSETLRTARASIEQQDVLLGERRAGIEEIDLAETLGALQLRQTGLEAALRATAASVQTSLMNYLR